MTIYENNIRALREHHPELLQLLDRPVRTEHIQVVPASNGNPRIMVRLKSGEKVALHDADDPWRVARGMAERLKRNRNGVLVLLGLELGYLVKALLPLLDERSRVVVFEADSGLFLTALQVNDLTEVLSSPKVTMLIGPNAQLADSCAQCLVDTGGTMRVVSSGASRKLDSRAYGEKVQQELGRLQTIVLATQNALGARGSKFVENILENVPQIVGCPGIHHLQGLFPNRPALLVAAGPSLEKNVHQLRSAKGYAVIIVADTALGYLLARGIVPDFVVSADPQETTYRKFENVDIPEKVSLVFHPAAHHQIIKHFPGRKFVMDTNIPVYQWIQRYGPRKGSLETETMCQIHIGFNLAEWLGCNAIILVGQDLCYADSRMHVTGSSYLTEEEEAWEVSKGEEAVNIFGEVVRTHPTFLNYKAILEKKIAKFTGRVVNSTEGGLPVEGAEPCRLKDALEALWPASPVQVWGVIHSIGNDPSPSYWNEWLREIRVCIRDFHRVGRTSLHICRLLGHMGQMRQTSPGAGRNLVRLGQKVKQLTGLIPSYPTARRLLHWMNIHIERQLKEDTSHLGRIQDQNARHDHQIQLGLRYYGGLAGTAPVLRRMFIRLLSRLEGVRDLEESPRSSMTDINILSSLEQYQSLEWWERAGSLLATGMAQGAIDSLTVKGAVLSIKIPFALHQLETAFDRTQWALSQFPDCPEIQSLGSEVENAWREWMNKVETGKAIHPILALI